MSEPTLPPIVAAEGWHVLHLFYRVDQGQWSLLSSEEQIEAKTRLSELVQEIRATEGCQLMTFAMVTPKADVGFMLLASDLHKANAFEKQLTQALGPDILQATYSYLSMTERSEYTTTDEQYAADLAAEGHAPGTPEHEQKMAEFQARMKKYLKDRLYPVLPPWEVMCFYPMNKRRGDVKNWYALSFEERKKLMGGHARVGRQWAGKILQLITGSTGLDDWEWGVTLLAHDPMDIKGIIYEMRFDPVSAEYAEFGEFYIGLQVPLDELFRRVLL